MTEAAKKRICTFDKICDKDMIMQVTGIALSFSGQSRTPSGKSCFKSVASTLQQPLQLTHSSVQDAPSAPTLQAQSGSFLAVNGSSSAVRQCMTLPDTIFNVDLDFGSLLKAFTNGLLMDDGNLRFPLPDLHARVSVTAKPVLLENPNQLSASKIGLVPSEIGSAPLEINGLNAYTATFTVTKAKLVATALLNPSFTGLYKIVITAKSEVPEINDWLSQLDSVAYQSLICNPLANASLP